MAVFTGYVLAGADDYEGGFNASSTNTVISAYNFDGGANNRYAYAKIDATGLPADAVISQVDLVYYHDSYVKAPKGETYYRTIGVLDTGSQYSSIFFSTGTPPASGWQTVSITDSGELTDMTTMITNNGELEFRFSVGSSSSISSRTWDIRSYEHTVGGAFAAYVEITYTLPSSLRRRAIIIS